MVKLTSRILDSKSFGELAERLIAIVLKTIVRKDLWVRILHSPPNLLVWRNGIRNGLKIRFPQGIESSNLSTSTSKITIIVIK